MKPLISLPPFKTYFEPFKEQSQQRIFGIFEMAEIGKNNKRISRKARAQQACMVYNL